MVFAVEGSSHGLLEAAELPYIPLPAYPSITSWPLLSADEKARLRLAMANSIVQIICPDLLVFDSIPSVQFATAAQQRGIPFAICHRKMKKEEYSAISGNIAEVYRNAQLILIPHSSGEME